MNIVRQTRFKKDFKRYLNNQRALNAIKDTIELLMKSEPLPDRYKEHFLIGEYLGYLECHALPDLLLIYKRTETDLILYRVGSHSDLF